MRDTATADGISRRNVGAAVAGQRLRTRPRGAGSDYLDAPSYEHWSPALLGMHALLQNRVLRPVAPAGYSTLAAGSVAGTFISTQQGVTPSPSYAG